MNETLNQLQQEMNKINQEIKNIESVRESLLKGNVQPQDIANKYNFMVLSADEQTAFKQYQESFDAGIKTRLFHINKNPNLTTGQKLTQSFSEIANFASSSFGIDQMNSGDPSQIAKGTWKFFLRSSAIYLLDDLMKNGDNSLLTKGFEHFAEMEGGGFAIIGIVAAVAAISAAVNYFTSTTEERKERADAKKAEKKMDNNIFRLQVKEVSLMAQLNEAERLFTLSCMCNTGLLSVKNRLEDIANLAIMNPLAFAAIPEQNSEQKPGHNFSKEQEEIKALKEKLEKSGSKSSSIKFKFTKQEIEGAINATISLRAAELGFTEAFVKTIPNSIAASNGMVNILSPIEEMSSIGLKNYEKFTEERKAQFQTTLDAELNKRPISQAIQPYVEVLSQLRSNNAEITKLNESLKFEKIDKINEYKLRKPVTNDAELQKEIAELKQKVVTSSTKAPEPITYKSNIEKFEKEPNLKKVFSSNPDLNYAKDELKINPSNIVVFTQKLDSYIEKHQTELQKDIEQLTKLKHSLKDGGEIKKEWDKQAGTNATYKNMDLEKNAEQIKNFKGYVNTGNFKDELLDKIARTNEEIKHLTTKTTEMRAEKNDLDSFKKEIENVSNKPSVPQPEDVKALEYLTNLNNKRENIRDKIDSLNVSNKYLEENLVDIGVKQNDSLNQSINHNLNASLSSKKSPSIINTLSDKISNIQMTESRILSRSSSTTLATIPDKRGAQR